MKILITPRQLSQITEMSFKAYHGTSPDFDSFSINKVGTGESTQWFGWGLYFSDQEDIANFYAKLVTNKYNQDTLEKSTLKINNDYTPYSSFYGTMINNLKNTYAGSQNIIKKKYDDFKLFAANKLKWEEAKFTEGDKNELIGYVVGELRSNIKYYEKNLGFLKSNAIKNSQIIINYTENPSIKEFEEKIEKMSEVINNIPTNPNILELIKRLSSFKPENFSLHTGVDKIRDKGMKYDVTIHQGKTPEEYDYITWYGKLTDSQKNKIINQFKKEKLKNKIFYVVKPENSETEIKPKFFDSFSDAKSHVDRSKTITFMGEVGKRVIEKQKMEIITDLGLDVKDFYIKLCGVLGSDKEASLFLLRSGIDGIKYPSNTIMGGDDDGINYVVFNDKSLTIDSKKQVDL